MSELRAKGSVLYKILILILAVVLISSILYPKIITEEQEQNAKISHHRMEEIYKAGLQYQKYKGTYVDTLANIFDFIRTSPEYAQYVDSVVVGGLDSIVAKLDEFKEKQELIKANVPGATDSMMIDSLAQMQDGTKFESRRLAGYVEYVHDRMKNLPNMPTDELTSAFIIIDSKQFTLGMDIVRNSITNGKLNEAVVACNDVLAVIGSISDQIKQVASKVPDYKDSNLDQLGLCPTTGRQFRLTHIDTSVIKYLNVYCPIDSSDIADADANFLKSKMGGLKLVNYGKIESNEKSWEE